MHRTISGRTDTTRRGAAPRTWLAALACAVLLAACAGGSGSSGFDAALKAENQAIDRAVESETCEVENGLTICASNTAPPPTSPTATHLPLTPTPLPASTPTSTLPLPTQTTASEASPSAPPADTTPTPTGTGHLGPTGTPTLATLGTPTVRFTATTTQASRITMTPTPTGTPAVSAPGVATNLGPADVIPCDGVDAQGTCTFIFAFQPMGLPPETFYVVGVRTRNPDSSWELLIPTNNQVAVPIDPNGPHYQFAVLAYLQDPGSVPEEVELLASSGADFAVVTPVLTPDTLLR